MSKHVQANEPGTLKYHLQVETKGDAPSIFVLERYKDKASLGAHGSSPEFKAFQKTLAKEGLLAEFKVYYTKGFGGFASRL
ncbi:hypothetical protein, variant [Verruconis gallopava]|nr:hypothetical protein, variant [Verruconis gallopava]KIW04900.1 hypothetical protein, variant [Verruconis gallopava]